MQFVCTWCGQRTPVTTRAPKCECGGLFELDFTPPAWDASLIDRTQWNQFRYRRFMALDGEAWREVTMGEGMTPIVPFDENVMLKMDYMMPTLSFKDRGAATLVAHMKAIGVTHCVQDSSGNAGNAVRGDELLEMGYRHHVVFVRAPEDKILAARAAIAKRGVYCEHTTAANYAAYLAYCEQYGPAPDTLITMCGAGIKSDH